MKNRKFKKYILELKDYHWKTKEYVKEFTRQKGREI